MSDRNNNFADDSAAAHDDEDDDDDVDVDVDLFPQCVGKGTGECSQSEGSRQRFSMQLSAVDFLKAMQ